MRIAAMAAGAVGGYFGARLAAAGHDVFFIARGANLAAMKSDGLKIESVHGDIHIAKPNVTDDPATVGPVDIVLFAVKLWDTETAAALTKPLVGPATRVITFQNGIDSVERIAPILGADRTAGGAAYIATTIAAPGVIRHTSSFAMMRFGRPDKRPDAALQAFLEAALKAKIDAAMPADIDRELWQKFTFLVAMSGATAALRSPIGAIVADPELRGFFRSLMDEVYAIAKARGVALDPAYIEERMKFVQTKIEPGMKASMAHDLERGNRLELDWLSGRVRELGRTLNIPTPANDAVYTMLKLHRTGIPR